MAGTIARQRYERSVLLLSLGYAVALFGVVALFRHGSPPGVAAYVAAILPALPIVGIFVALGRYIAGEEDEYQRMLLVRRSLVATGLTLSAATVWGFLEGFELVPHVAGYAAAILWFAGFGLAGCVDRLRLGRIEAC